MSSVGWRRIAILLTAICIYQGWRDCSRGSDHEPATAVADCSKSQRPSDWRPSSNGESAQGDAPATAPPVASNDGMDIYGFKVPGWAMWFAPQPGEDMLAYRDRIVPVAQRAIAPQRARVARVRDDFAQQAHLDQHQLAELDGATKDAATEIENRLVSAVMNGEFSPATKPMAGVELARELLDDVDHQNKRFLAALTDDQRAQLEQNRFDFGDYLLFSTPWEEALGIVQ
jgi:hypothetical protein